jgi:proline iminopeptidase
MSGVPPETEALLYPALEPDRQGLLPVADGHRLYYEQSGTPQGLPVVCLHGGPGSGSNPALRRFLDPKRCRIIVYDQRGTGRSEPAGELRANATPALVEDLEALRQHLSIERWLLFGGSWGATLALAYAQAHAHRVLGLILRGPLLGRRRDLDWFFGPDGVARLFPREYRAFLSVLPEHLRARPLSGYMELFRSPLPEDRRRAARAWAAWDRCVATADSSGQGAEANPARYAIACHYAANGFFLPENGILNEAHELAGIPGVLVQGQLDLVCPAEGAATLAEHWPQLGLHIVPGAGHLATEPAIARVLVDAAREFTSRLT